MIIIGGQTAIAVIMVGMVGAEENGKDGECVAEVAIKGGASRAGLE